MTEPRTLPPWNRTFTKVLEWCVGIPVLLLVSGAFISLPAWFLSRGRDPWYTLLLALGLATIVFGTGIPAAVPAAVLSSVFAGSVLVLVVLRALFGPKARNVENFAPIYMLTALAMVCTLQVHKLKLLHATQATPKAEASFDP